MESAFDCAISSLLSAFMKSFHPSCEAMASREAIADSLNSSTFAFSAALMYRKYWLKVIS